MSVRLTFLWIIIPALGMLSCSGIQLMNKSEFSDGYYRLRQKQGKYERVYVEVDKDSLVVSQSPGGTLVASDVTKPRSFLRGSLDIDLLSIPFKYRPAAVNLPRQLTNNFNAGLYLGYRKDRFRILTTRGRFGIRKKVQHMALSGGFFAGMGSAFLSPWTTNYQIPEEYNALILSRGFSLMLGNDSFTAGLALGWDYLTDRDKHVWIYQNKPWYGLAISFNLN